MSKYSKIIGDLFWKWESAKIIYCHWKSINHLQATYQGETDIDVLVNEHDASKAIEIAQNNGFIKLNTVYLRSYPCVFDFVAYDSRLDKWIHLHFHTKLICGDRWVKAYHLPFEKNVFHDRYFDKEFNTWTIHPKHELLILFYRMNAKFKNKNWPRDQRILDEIYYLLDRKTQTQELKTSLDLVCGGWRNKLYFDKLLEQFQERKEVDASELKEILSPRKYRRMSSLKFFIYSKLRLFYRIYIEIRRRRFKKYDIGRRKLPFGGIVVSFVGIDGSGKSSGLENIAAFFGKQINVQKNFLGSGKSGAGIIRKIIMNMFGFKATFKGHKEVRNSDLKEKKIPPFYYIIWILLCLKDREKHVEKIKHGLANGNLILVDRWPQNSVSGGVDSPRLSNYIDNKGFVGRIAKREAKLYEEIEQIPLHLVIKLNIEAEKSVERKPKELTLEMASKAIKKLNDISWPNDAVIAEIDANKEQADVLSQIKLGIWHILYKLK